MKDKISHIVSIMISVISIEIAAISIAFVFLDKSGYNYENLPYLFVIILLVSALLGFAIIYYNRLKYQSNEYRKNIEHQQDVLNKLVLKYDLGRENLEEQIAILQKRIADNQEHIEESYHLPFSAQKKDSYTQNSLENFKNKFGLRDDDFTVDPQMIFMLTPFSVLGNDLYLSVREICSKSGLNLYRGDEKHSNNDILDNIIRLIVKSRVIIANINGKNPNVFYELGIAHTLGKPVILLCQADNEMTNAFDIRQNNTIFYTNRKDMEEKLSAELLKVLAVN